MKNADVDEGKLERGEYCHKGVFGCFCAVGYPPERQCPDCRDRWAAGQFRDSYCICPPKGEKPWS